MQTYLISYDLNKTGQKYEALYEAIKSLGSWWHCLDSTWLVNTDKTAVQIRDHLNTKALDSNDKLLVVKAGPEGAWLGFDKDCSSWLKSNL